MKTDENEMALERLIKLVRSKREEIPEMPPAFATEVIRKAWPKPEFAEIAGHWLTGMRWGTLGAVTAMTMAIVFCAGVFRSKPVSPEEAIFLQVEEVLAVR